MNKDDIDYENYNERLALERVLRDFCEFASLNPSDELINEFLNTLFDKEEE